MRATVHRRVITACLQGKATGESVRLKIRSRINKAISACRAKQTEQTHPIVVTACIDNTSAPCMFWHFGILPRGFPSFCSLSCRSESRCSWDVLVHAAPFAQLSSAALVKVAVVAPPRWLPHVKHTNWVSSRSSNITVSPLAPCSLRVALCLLAALLTYSEAKLQTSLKAATPDTKLLLIKVEHTNHHVSLADSSMQIWCHQQQVKASLAPRKASCWRASSATCSSRRTAIMA